MNIENITERIIAEAVVRGALAEGYTISVFDEMEWTVKDSSDFTEVMEALCTTSMDKLAFKLNGDGRGWILLVWGNGCDLISDYTVTLDDFMKKHINAVVDGLEKGELPPVYKAAPELLAALKLVLREAHPITNWAVSGETLELIEKIIAIAEGK